MPVPRNLIANSLVKKIKTNNKLVKLQPPNQKQLEGSKSRPFI